MIEFTRANQNIIIIEFLSEDTFKMFLVKGNMVLFSQLYTLGSTKLELLIEKIKLVSASTFKINTSRAAVVVSKDDIDEAQIIYSYLKSSTCKYRVIPERYLLNSHDSLFSAAIFDLLTTQNDKISLNKTLPLALE